MSAFALLALLVFASGCGRYTAPIRAAEATAQPGSTQPEDKGATPAQEEQP